MANMKETSTFEKLLLPNIDIKEVPIVLDKTIANEGAEIDNQIQLLDILHTIILIMTIIILIMVLKIHFFTPILSEQ